MWNEPERAQALGKERSSLEAIVDTLDQMSQGLEDVAGLLDLAVEADDEETFNEAVAELDTLEEKLAQLEFRRMFSGEYDSADCYLDIQAGSGGTEAQDWASMLMRMYLRWAEARGFKTEIIEESEGEVAGIKSVTIKIIGDYAYGWLRTETGVHRLVRIISILTQNHLIHVRLFQQHIILCIDTRRNAVIQLNHTIIQ